MRTTISKTAQSALTFYHSLPQTLQHQLSISSLNVLADIYVDEPKEEHLLWEHRRRLLHQHFREINSDVICLQEVQTSQYEEDFLSYFRTLGYEGVLQDSGHVVSVATFFKTSKLTLDWTESRSRAMLVGLRMKIQLPSEEEEVEVEEFSVPFVVCNLHLQGHFSETVTRFSQIKSLLKRCEIRLAKETPSESLVVVCGDFNSTLTGGVVKTMVEGELSPEFLENGVQTTATPFKHPFVFANAYAREETRHPTFFRSYLVSTIDHLFVNSNLVDTLGLLSIKQKELQEMKETFLPCASHPSDHLPVGAVFQFKAKALEMFRRKGAKT